MTVRGTLGLLAIFAVLAAYLLLVPPPSASLLPLGNPLLTGPTERVTAVEVLWPDGRLRANRAEDRWRIDGGAALPPGMVEDLLAALSTLRPTEALAGSAATADYGFAAPRTSLVLSADGTPVLALEVGGRNPAWTGVYVRRTGSGEIALVGALLHWELEKLHAMARG